MNWNLENGRLYRDEFNWTPKRKYHKPIMACDCVVEELSMSKPKKDWLKKAREHYLKGEPID